MGENDHLQRGRDSLSGYGSGESCALQMHRFTHWQRGRRPSESSYEPEPTKEAALRLQRGGTRRGMLASALFGPLLSH